jgi:uncharacterized protein YcnI
MEASMKTAALTTAVLLLTASQTFAHVTVAPAASRAGASERYVVRVPTEGKVATVETELEIPDGVSITPMAPMGWTHELKRTGDKVTAIVWKMEIKPAEFAEFVFSGRNPKDAASIVWKVHQRYADGTASHWVGEAGTRSPAPVTTLSPSAQDDAAGIQAWLAGYDQAFVAKDLTKLAGFYDAEVTIYEGGGINRGWADYRDNHLGPELKSFEQLQFAHSNVNVRMLAAGVAYVTSDYTLKTIVKDRAVESGGLETLVVARASNGTWQIRHSHTSAKRRPQ